MMLFYDQIQYFLLHFLGIFSDFDLENYSLGFLLNFVNEIEYIDHQWLNSALPIDILLFDFNILGQKIDKLKADVPLLLININLEINIGIFDQLGFESFGRESSTFLLNMM